MNEPEFFEGKAFITGTEIRCIAMQAKSLPKVPDVIVPTPETISDEIMKEFYRQVKALSKQRRTKTDAPVKDTL